MPTKYIAKYRVDRKPPSPFGGVFIAVRERLRLSQSEVAREVGLNARSVIRWEQSRVPTLDTLKKLVAFVRKLDEGAAAELATAAGASLESVGLATPAQNAESLAHSELVARAAVESALYAAADTLDTSPRSLKPALIAALDRLASYKLTLAQALAILRTPPPSAP